MDQDLDLLVEKQKEVKISRLAKLKWRASAYRIAQKFSSRSVIGTPMGRKITKRGFGYRAFLNRQKRDVSNYTGKKVIILKESPIQQSSYIMPDHVKLKEIKKLTHNMSLVSKVINEGFEKVAKEVTNRDVSFLMEEVKPLSNQKRVELFNFLDQKLMNL